MTDILSLSSNLYTEQFRFHPNSHRTPQIVVVGDVGSGKKTLVERLLLYPVPKAKLIPIHFRIRKGDEKSDMVYIKGVEEELAMPLDSKETAHVAYNELLHAAERVRVDGSTLSIVVAIVGPDCSDLDVLILPGLSNASHKPDQIRVRQDLSNLVAESTKFKNIFFLVTDPVNTRLNNTVVVAVWLKLFSTLQVRVPGLIVVTKFDNCMFKTDTNKWAAFIELLKKPSIVNFLQIPHFVCVSVTRGCFTDSIWSATTDDLDGTERPFFTQTDTLSAGLLPQHQATCPVLMHYIKSFCSAYRKLDFLPQYVFQLLVKMDAELRFPPPARVMSDGTHRLGGLSDTELELRKALEYILSPLPFPTDNATSSSRGHIGASREYSPLNGLLQKSVDALKGISNEFNIPLTKYGNLEKLWALSMWTAVLSPPSHPSLSSPPTTVSSDGVVATTPLQALPATRCMFAVTTYSRGRDRGVFMCLGQPRGSAPPVGDEIYLSGLDWVCIAEVADQSILCTQVIKTVERDSKLEFSFDMPPVDALKSLPPDKLHVNVKLTLFGAQVESILTIPILMPPVAPPPPPPEPPVSSAGKHSHSSSSKSHWASESKSVGSKSIGTGPARNMMGKKPRESVQQTIASSKGPAPEIHSELKATMAVHMEERLTEREGGNDVKDPSEDSTVASVLLQTTHCDGVRDIFDEMSSDTKSSPSTQQQQHTTKSAKKSEREPTPVEMEVETNDHRSTWRDVEGKSSEVETIPCHTDFIPTTGDSGTSSVSVQGNITESQALTEFLPVLQFSESVIDISNPAIAERAYGDIIEPPPAGRCKVPQLMVIGTVGSGKKTLLSALLDHAVPDTNDMRIVFKLRRSSFGSTIKKHSEVHVEYDGGVMADMPIPIDPTNSASAHEVYKDVLTRVKSRVVHDRLKLQIVITMTGPSFPVLDITILPDDSTTMKAFKDHRRSDLHKMTYYLFVVDASSRLQSYLVYSILMRVEMTANDCVVFSRCDLLSHPDSFGSVIGFQGSTLAISKQWICTCFPTTAVDAMGMHNLQGQTSIESATTAHKVGDHSPHSRSSRWLPEQTFFLTHDNSTGIYCFHSTVGVGCLKLLRVIEDFYITTCLRVVFPELIFRMQMEYDMLKANGRLEVNGTFSFTGQQCVQMIYTMMGTIDQHLDRHHRLRKSKQKVGNKSTSSPTHTQLTSVDQNREDSLWTDLKLLSERIAGMLAENEAASYLCVWSLVFNRAQVYGPGIIAPIIGEKSEIGIQIPERLLNWKCGVDDTMITMKLIMRNPLNGKRENIEVNRSGDKIRRDLLGTWNIEYNFTLPKLSADKLELTLEVFILGDICIANSPILMLAKSRKAWFRPSWK